MPIFIIENFSRFVVIIFENVMNLNVNNNVTELCDNIKFIKYY